MPYGLLADLSVYIGPGSTMYKVTHKIFTGIYLYKSSDRAFRSLIFILGEPAGRQFSCLACTGGSTCGAGTITPTPCGTGSYTPDGETVCTTCEIGYVMKYE